MTVGKVSDASFESDVLKSAEPVVVDFWAEWCGPCRMIAPALEEIAGQLGNKVKIVKLNVDENPNTAAKYGIMSIPTLMLFKNGEIASAMGDKVKIVKLNVDENPQVASKYGVMSIPTLMIFKGGEMASRQVGAAPKQKLQQWISATV